MLSKPGFHEFIQSIHCLFIQQMFSEPLHVLSTVLGTRVWNFCYLTLLGAKERVQCPLSHFRKKVMSREGQAFSGGQPEHQQTCPRSPNPQRGISSKISPPPHPPPLTSRLWEGDPSTL